MIPDFGHHTPFILASYGIEALVLGALIGWLVWDGRRQEKALAALEQRRKPSSPKRAETTHP